MGNELGAGRPKQAKLVVMSALTVTPLMWAVIAGLLVEPHAQARRRVPTWQVTGFLIWCPGLRCPKPSTRAQAALLSLYLDGSDAVLWARLRELLLIVAVTELFDSLQTVLGGVVQVWPWQGTPPCSRARSACLFLSVAVLACPDAVWRHHRPFFQVRPCMHPSAAAEAHPDCVQSGQVCVLCLLSGAGGAALHAFLEVLQWKGCAVWSHACSEQGSTRMHAQGAGKQQRGALVNLVAFYLLAMPLALFLAFYMHLGVVGLFIGLGTGPLVQSLLYSIVVYRLDWGSEACKAMDLASKEEAAVLERTLSEASQPLLGRRSSSAYPADGEAVVVSVSTNGHAQAEEQP